MLMASEIPPDPLETSPSALELFWTDLGPWIQSGFVLVGAFVAYLLVRNVVLRPLSRLAASTESDLDDRLVDFARSFLGVVVLFFAILLILGIHGVKVTAWLAGAGIAGIAIGLAAKETLADILAGVFLVLDRPMRIGDRVKIERIGTHWGGWGDVVDVGLRRTVIRNTDGVIVNYPNHVLASSVITNFSFEKEPVRVRVRFMVDYEADLELAREVGERAIARTPGVLPDTAQIVVRSLWDDQRGHLLAGVLLEGRYRIEDVKRRTPMRSLVLSNLLADLRQAGIPLPSPRLRVTGPITDPGTN